MINIMYLVLLALLALNVAGEVLNAFKILDDSIQHSSVAIQGKNAILLAQFDHEMKTQGALKVGPYKAKAEDLHKRADVLLHYISKLRDEVIEASDGKKVGNKIVYKEDDLDAATRVMIVEKKGVELKKKIEELRTFYLKTLVSPEDLKEQEKQLLLKTSLSEETKSLVRDEMNPDPDWSYVHFHMMPSIGAVTILDKFKNDVINAESNGLEYLLHKINAMDVKFDRFEPLVSSRSSYLMTGETFEAVIGVGAFSSKAEPRILIDGVPLPVKDGKAVYKEPVKRAGRKVLKVRVIMRLPDGRDQPFDKEIVYEAGVPSGATVTADKVNVLYRGIENPVTVSAGPAGQELIKVAMTNAKFSGSGSRYMVIPGSAPNTEITVRVKDRVNKFNFRVKDIPPPVAYVGNFSSVNNVVPIAVFKAQGGVKAVLKDFLFEGLDFKVLSYRVGAAGPGFPDGYRIETNEGAPWVGKKAERIINQAKPGARIFIDDIQVKGPDGRTSKLAPLVFTMK